MKIIVDCFGGDHAPLEILKGSLMAAKEFGVQILLTGRETQIRRCAQENGLDLSGTEIADCPDVVTMHDSPRSVLKEKKDSSMALGFRLLNEGAGDAFVSAVGSGGTITGTGQFLRRCDPGIRVVAVEPKGSPVLSGGKAGPHKIQGIGAGFVPGTLDTSVYHEVMQVGNEEAAAMTRLVLKTDGVFVGISSGSALEAAVRLARKPPYDHGRIVVIFPDSGERYLSTGLFSE